VADPAFTEIPLERMLSKEWAREQAQLMPRGSGRQRRVKPRLAIGGGCARRCPAGAAAMRDAAGDGDTVFLGVVDAQGNAVSLIQSLFNSFGSGRMVPGTGIVLHNRGAHFSLVEGSMHVMAPRKRPYHTLSPAMVLRPDGSLHMVFGTPGSDGQTQTLLQVFNNIVLFGMTPQRAVEAPRWRWWSDGRLQVEVEMPDEVLTRCGGGPRRPCSARHVGRAGRRPGHPGDAAGGADGGRRPAPGGLRHRLVGRAQRSARTARTLVTSMSTATRLWPPCGTMMSA
jgi:gamma-glutamyltranspeptidase